MPQSNGIQESQDSNTPRSEISTLEARSMDSMSKENRSQSSCMYLPSEVEDHLYFLEERLINSPSIPKEVLLLKEFSVEAFALQKDILEALKGLHHLDSGEIVNFEVNYRF